MTPPQPIYLRLSRALLLSLTMVCPPLVAQPASDSSQETAQASQPEKDDSHTTTPQPKTQESPNGGKKNSPFDYRPSEEISEDLPVSFPVDI